MKTLRNIAELVGLWLLLALVLSPIAIFEIAQGRAVHAPAHVRHVSGERAA